MWIVANNVRRNNIQRKSLELLVVDWSGEIMLLLRNWTTWVSSSI